MEERSNLRALQKGSPLTALVVGVEYKPSFVILFQEDHSDGWEHALVDRAQVDLISKPSSCLLNLHKHLPEDLEGVILNVTLLRRFLASDLSDIFM